MSREDRARIFIICPLHSAPGAPVAAIVKPFYADLMALCPGCIEEGKQIRERMGKELVETPVTVKPATTEGRLLQMPGPIDNEKTSP